MYDDAYATLGPGDLIEAALASAGVPFAMYFTTLLLKTVSFFIGPYLRKEKYMVGVYASECGRRMVPSTRRCSVQPVAAPIPGPMNPPRWTS